MGLHHGGCWSLFVVCVSIASSLCGGGGVVFAQAQPREVYQPQEHAAADALPACCAEEIEVLRVHALDAVRCGLLPRTVRQEDDLCLSGWDAGALLLEFEDLLKRCPACASALTEDLATLRRIRIAHLEETFRIYGLDFHVNYWDPNVRHGLIHACARLLAGTEGIPVNARDAEDICTMDPTAHIRCALDVPGAVVEYIALLQATHAPARRIQDIAMFLHRHSVDPLPFVCEGCAAFTPTPPTAPRP